jgi:hypothetical protein
MTGFDEEVSLEHRPVGECLKEIFTEAWGSGSSLPARARIREATARFNVRVRC